MIKFCSVVEEKISRLLICWGFLGKLEAKFGLSPLVFVGLRHCLVNGFEGKLIGERFGLLVF